jgi:hypothetical protein
VKEEQRRDSLTSEPTPSINKKQKRKLEIIDASYKRRKHLDPESKKDSSSD